MEFARTRLEGRGSVCVCRSLSRQGFDGLDTLAAAPVAVKTKTSPRKTRKTQKVWEVVWREMKSRLCAGKKLGQDVGVAQSMEVCRWKRKKVQCI